jgi:hypothetical protein
MKYLPINNCNDCKHYNINKIIVEYDESCGNTYGYEKWCMKSKKRFRGNHKSKIPKWCSLKERE